MVSTRKVIKDIHMSVFPGAELRRIALNSTLIFEINLVLADIGRERPSHGLTGKIGKIRSKANQFIGAPQQAYGSKMENNCIIKT